MNKRSSFLPLFIILLTSFITGYIFSLYINQDRPNISKKGLKEVSQNDYRLDMSRFWKTYDLIEENFYNSKDVDKQKLIDGATKGLVDSLGDKHSEFMNLEETEQFEANLSGDFEGIGAVVEKVGLGIIIERIIKGSPAKKYGLLKGDIIIEANGSSLEDLSLYEGVDKIKGPADTAVELKILRTGETEVLVKNVVREKIKIPSIESEIFEDNNFGYISLNIFGENTAIEFKKELENIKSKNVAGLIIDLRDNGGGYLNSAIEILSEFIEKDKVIVTTDSKKIFGNKSYTSINTGDVFEKPIVVIINENSASASEITAGALKDYKKAIIIGQKSYGKGSVQQPFDLDKGALLKLTIAAWLTPKGNTIEGEGIEPDIEVLFEKEDFENKYDRQLEEAKKILQKFVEKKSLIETLQEYKRADTIQN